MKLKQIEKIYKALGELPSVGSVKFRLAMKFNRTSLKTYIDTLEELKKEIFTQEMIEYEQNRHVIVKEYAEKDSEGNPKISNDGVVIDKTKIAEFNSRISTYMQEHKNTSSALEKVVTELESALDQDYEIQLHYILLEDVPDEIMDFDTELSSTCFEFVK